MKANKPDYLDQLIELASEKAGSDSALGRLIESPPQRICDWRAGRATCPIADQVLMASIAGLKAEEWAARALVASYSGSKKGQKLEQALKKLLVATGAALATSGATAATATFSTMATLGTDAAVFFYTMYKKIKKKMKLSIVTV